LYWVEGGGTDPQKKVIGKEDNIFGLETWQGKN